MGKKEKQEESSCKIVTVANGKRFLGKKKCK